MTDELDDNERASLDAWTTLTPPPGFADRVLAARTAPKSRRWPFLAGGLAVAAAATVFVMTRQPSHAASGELVDARQRTTKALGDRAVAVAEPSATLTWRINDDGDAVIEQRAGDVFYRVDRGGPFVVHTPAGDVHVTGTCFRIEVEPMNRTKQLLLSGTVGAALASAVVITVYEGHVVADSKTGNHTQIAAGNRATLGPNGHTLVVAGKSTPSSDAPDPIARTIDTKTATREELVARAEAQDAEIAKLHTRVAELENNGHILEHDQSDPGRPWHDPSPETLKSWAGECHIRNDEPGLDRWQPQTTLGKNERGLEPSELGPVNDVMAQLQKDWKALVKQLYIEATGDVQGAETLSTEAMRREIEEKGAPGEHENILQRIAQERAGLVPAPTAEQIAKSSPFERLFRSYLELGDKTEAALAKRLGPDRAAAIRGDGWGSRSDWSGCPHSE
jgi:hypothetical protein